MLQESANVNKVVNALCGNDPILRWAAAESIPTLPNRNSLPISALCQALKDPAEAVRLAVIDALASMGPNARAAGPALIESLQDQSADVRNAAADALAATGNGIPSILPILMRQISSPKKELRCRAAIALGNLGPLGLYARAALIQAARDPDHEVSTAAGWALSRIQKSFAPPTKPKAPLF